MKRAQSYDEIKPLIDLCKEGKLLDVQKWILAGKPINPPVPIELRKRKHSPLQVAINSGFHSLVEVLLDAGAGIEEQGYNPLEHAVKKRRLDLVELLISYGADLHSVNMEFVFDTWDPKIMRFFIDNGADVETENPLAKALCDRIRTALGIFKQYKKSFASFLAQANIALRYHCKEGDLKWVSLLIWAGADPYATGPDSHYDKPDPEGDTNALALAALWGYFDIYKLKGIRLDPKHPGAKEVFRMACYSKTCHFLEELLNKGFSPLGQEDDGSSLIQMLL